MEYSNIQIKAIIDEWVHSERDRKILYRRLVDGIHFEPLAEEFGLTTRYVKTIVYKHEETIFSHLPG